MFNGFAKVWTPVELSKRVGRRRPVRVHVAGEAIALFRTRDGRVAALLDRCPHRGVSLSLGKVTEDGRLECPFHGWQFEGGGACAHIPYCDLPAEKRSHLGTIGLPVREVSGLIWLFTGALNEDSAAGEPAIPEMLVEGAGSSLWIHTEVWRTHWTRAMENMLDFPHLPFIHRRTIGRKLRASLKSGSTLKLAWEPSETGAMIRASFDGEPAGASLEWRRPNAMVLGLDPPGRKMRMHVWSVPIDEKSTRLILVAARDFWRNPIGELFDQFNRLILLEDRSVVESSDPPEVPPPGEELSVATDAPTLAFRRYYYRELRGRGAGDLVDARRLARSIRAVASESAAIAASPPSPDRPTASQPQPPSSPDVSLPPSPPEPPPPPPAPVAPDPLPPVPLAN
jgi:phenylpropionate dioxygenase-like ring-hydroxylating dioxygenase large terminal subunit